MSALYVDSALWVSVTPWRSDKGLRRIRAWLTGICRGMSETLCWHLLSTSSYWQRLAPDAGAEFIKVGITLTVLLRENSCNRMTLIRKKALQNLARPYVASVRNGAYVCYLDLTLVHVSLLICHARAPEKANEHWHGASGSSYYRNRGIAWHLPLPTSDGS